MAGEWDGRGSLIVVYEVATGKEIQRLEGKKIPDYHCLALSPTRPVLALGGPGLDIRFLVPATGTPDLSATKPGDAPGSKAEQAFRKACKQLGELEGKHAVLLKGLSKLRRALTAMQRDSTGPPSPSRTTRCRRARPPHGRKTRGNPSRISPWVCGG